MGHNKRVIEPGLYRLFATKAEAEAAHSPDCPSRLLIEEVILSPSPVRIVETSERPKPSPHGPKPIPKKFTPKRPKPKKV